MTGLLVGGALWLAAAVIVLAFMRGCSRAPR